MKNFNIFTKECDKWIKRIGLDDWGVTYQAISSSVGSKLSYATISRNAVDHKARVNFYVEQNKGRPEQDIKNTAKHEMIHLLLGDIIELAEERYIRFDELVSREEALVQKLSRLI